jgi:putative ABC transport system permease protein
MNFITLAVKNLMRRRGRTVLTVLGVAIAISVLFSLIALNTGYEIELNREMNSLGAHILAVPKGCPYEAASLMIHGGVIPKYLNISDLDMVNRIEGVEVASPLLMYQFYKRDEATGQNNPHIVYGIEMKEMSQIKPWWRVEGGFFEDDEKNVKVVGRELAEKENLTVGQVMPFGPDR